MTARLLFGLLAALVLGIARWSTKPPKTRGSYPDLMHRRMERDYSIRKHFLTLDKPIGGDAGDRTYEERVA
jgi:hypothetical protein